MKKLEIIIASLSMVFLIIRLFIATDLNWPFVVCCFLLIYLYGLSGIFIFNDIKFSELFKRGTWTKRVIGSLGLSFIYVFAVAGITTKIYSLPGAAPLSYFAAFLLLFVATPIVIFKKKKSNYYKQFLIRNLVFICLLVALIALPKKYQIKIFYKDHPVLVEKYINYLDDPSNIELLEEVNKEKEKL